MSTRPEEPDRTFAYQTIAERDREDAIVNGTLAEYPLTVPPPILVAPKPVTTAVRRLSPETLAECREVVDRADRRGRAGY